MDANYEMYGKIICAAILHNNCIYMSKKGHHAIFPMEPKGILRTSKQGFVTENGFFVDRKLGLLIARHYDQIDPDYPFKDELFSEFLRKEDSFVLKHVKGYTYKE